MTLWEPDDNYAVLCDVCGEQKRPDEMEHSETINICRDCSEREMKDWDKMMKNLKEISN